MIQARIQGHPSRAHLHASLSEALGLPVEIRLHSSDPPSPWAGYRACLRDLPDCSHLLVIQDDARVCRNFGPAVEQIAEATDVPVSLFLARLPRRTSVNGMKAAKAKLSYVQIALRDFVPVVALLWPVEKAREFMEWVDGNPSLPGQREPRSDDAMVGRWMMVTRQRILATVPSLVQHPDEEPSLIGRQAMWGQDKGRVAQLLAEDGLAHEWSVVQSM